MSSNTINVNSSSSDYPRTIQYASSPTPSANGISAGITGIQRSNSLQEGSSVLYASSGGQNAVFNKGKFQSWYEASAPSIKSGVINGMMAGAVVGAILGGGAGMSAGPVGAAFGAVDGAKWGGAVGAVVGGAIAAGCSLW